MIDRYLDFFLFFYFSFILFLFFVYLTIIYYVLLVGIIAQKVGHVWRKNLRLCDERKFVT